MSDLTSDETIDLYRVFVLHADESCPTGKPSCALSLLALWDAPWSPTAMRFAYHALARAYAVGCDPLEAARIPCEVCNGGDEGNTCC